jgi:hypothetical protein
MPAMPRKTTPRRPSQPAEAPLSYPQWKARAVEIMGGRPGTMRESAWKREFITGATPEEAAALAATYRRNTMAADRKRKR